MRQFAFLYPAEQFPAQAVPQLPWGHIVVLIQKVKEASIRMWYAQQAFKQGWSRNILIHQINSDLYERQAKSVTKITNFKERLPAPQSDLAQELIKDPYNFGFLPISAQAKERDLELGLIDHIRKLLMELGSGFAFVGNQYHLNVGGDDFYIDLLFFNITLNCYFVLEIKSGKFKPEYAGKLNFYITALDRELKQAHHNSTIGLLLCSDKNKMVAEYSLQKVESPIGIAQYELSRSVPDEYKDVLPSVEVLEDKLSSEVTAQAEKHELLD